MASNGCLKTAAVLSDDGGNRLDKVLQGLPEANGLAREHSRREYGNTAAENTGTLTSTSSGHVLQVWLVYLATYG